MIDRSIFHYYRVPTHRAYLVLVPSFYGSLTCWVCYNDGSIEREHLKGPGSFRLLEEISEDEMKKECPTLFTCCLDQKSSIAGEPATLRELYTLRYQEESSTQGKETYS